METHPQIGSFVMNIGKHVSLNMDVRDVDHSATLAINERCRGLRGEGKEVYRLGLGLSPFPIPVSVVDALKLHAHEKDYLPSEGLPALRAAVAEFHRRKDGIDARPEDVLIGPGSKELMFLLQLVFYGELMVPTPCWVSYVPQARILGRKVHLVHTQYEEKWKINAEALEKHCYEERDPLRPRILVLNYPSNPDGGTYSPVELKDLAEVARRYQVILLSDEIYGQLHHEGTHVSVARYYPEGTIISSGLSKWCGAGGWRLGTFTFPSDLDWLLKTMAAVASETYTSVSAPIQHAAVRAFRGGVKIERYLWHVRRILAAIGTRCVGLLDGAGVRVHPPVGGFYLFLDFSPMKACMAERGIFGSARLCESLLQDTGVAILPGAAFGRPPEELTARMAYVDFDGAKALTASETIPLEEKLPEDFTRLWCHNIIDAVRILCEWSMSGFREKTEAVHEAAAGDLIEQEAGTT